MVNKIIYLILALFVVIIIIPLLITRGVFFFGEEKGEEIIIKVYNTELKEIVEMELEEYLVGVVAAEMPANYHQEALKAQAVAARTYAARHLSLFGGNGSQQYPGADICTDYRFSQAWISKDSMKEKWGFIPFFYFYNRINEAVEETKGKVIVYNNKLIDAVYHSNAGGMTEDPYYVWGNRVPYLKSVKSPYDSKKKKNYIYNFNFKLTDVDMKLGTSLEEIVAGVQKNSESRIISFNKNNIIKTLQKSNSGRIVKIRFGDKIIGGQELRRKLSLPSNLAEFEIRGSKLFCTVKGNGHGVGMSQTGADGFAKNNYNYKEILKHYYQEVEIKNIKELIRYKTTSTR